MGSKHRAANASECNCDNLKSAKQKTKAANVFLIELQLVWVLGRDWSPLTRVIAGVNCGGVYHIALTNATGQQLIELVQLANGAVALGMQLV